MTTAPGPDGEPAEVEELVQMNVRVPRSLRDAIDARREPLNLSRDKWVARALRWALAQPKPSTRSTIARTTTGRTARSRR